MPAVSADIKEKLLALKVEDCTVDFLVSKIAKTTKITRDSEGLRRGFNVKPPEWDIKATMTLKPGEYINEDAVQTTVGQFLFNKLIIENKIESVIPNHYVNDVVDKKTIGKIVNMVSMGLTEKKIPLMPNVTDFIQAFEFYGLMLCPALSPSMTPALFSVQKEIREERDKRFAELGENPDIAEIVKVEDSLVKFAAEKLKDDPGMALFNSGSRGSFDDNYKMMSLTVGPVKNPATGEYDLVKSNYIDGIQKKELPAMGNVIVNAAFPKAVGTADGGYITKQFYAVFQSLVLDKKGSDCKSVGYFTAWLDANNYSSYMYQYAVVNGKKVLMTNENRNQFINRVVQMRSPIGCTQSKICNACMGERYYMLGIENAGLTAGRLPNAILNAGMKAFHATKVHLHRVDPKTLLL